MATERKTPHTPTPWEARPVPGMSMIAIAEQGKMYPHAKVETAHDGTRKVVHGLTRLELANAEFIVNACNNHERLVWALDGLAKHVSQYGHTEDVSGYLDAAYEALQLANAPDEPAAPPEPNT